MPVETFGFIDDLNASNPPASDGVVGGDDHLRGIKATLLAAFPNLTAAMTATAAQLNQLATGVIAFADGTLLAPAMSFTSELGLGFYRSASGFISFTGRLLGNGAVPTGAVVDFLSTTIPTGWYRLNGQAVSRTGATLALFTMLGTTYGAGDGSTTFNLPNLETLSLFRRASVTPGTIQTELIKSHTAPVTGTAADHNHVINIIDPGHVHSIGNPGSTYLVGIGAGGIATLDGTPGNISSTGFNNLNASNVTATSNNSGALALSGTATYTGGAETRPANISVVACIKA